MPTLLRPMTKTKESFRVLQRLEQASKTKTWKPTMPFSRIVLQRVNRLATYVI